jgi:hypothetical protein
MGSLAAEPIRLASYLADPRALDAVVVELQHIERQTGMDRTLTVGKLILERFFGGSAQAWHERRKNKNNSVRRLAQRPGCPFRRSALNQAIGIYVVCRSLECERKFVHVGVTHIAAILHLDLEAQRQWLERAEQGRWSVHELKERVTSERRQTGERRGRPRGSRKGRLLSSLSKMVGALEKAVVDLAVTDVHLGNRSDLTDLAERLAVVERQMLRAFRRPAHSEPCVPAAVPAKTNDGRSANPLKDVG